MTDDELRKRVQAHGPLTPREIWDQRVSFVYGNLAIDNPNITREMVEQRVTEIYGPRPS